METNPYPKLNTAFKQLSKTLFGDEFGELKDYAEWLKEYMHDPSYCKSIKSGKDVYAPHNFYEKEAPFISFDEIDFNKRFEPLNINEIKDIDSIADALKERFVYTGNVILGNSNFVKSSSSVFDSFYVSHAQFVDQSKYVAYSSQVRHSEYIFGSVIVAHSGYMIRTDGAGPNVRRAFESYFCGDASDIYYSVHIFGSAETMFSFFVSGHRYVIGNNILERSKYLSIKSALLEQILDDLRKKKFLSYKDLLVPKEVNPIKDIKEQELDVDIDLVKKNAKKNFAKATKIILGKELDLDKYYPYLIDLCPFYDIVDEVSPLTGKNIKYFKSIYKHDDLKSVFLGMEWPYAFNLKIPMNVVETKELSKIAEGAKPIAFESIYFYDDSSNVWPPLCAQHGLDCYNVILPIHMAHSAYSMWPRDSEYAFGSSQAFRSKFVINTYFSAGITRGFEIDVSLNSYDIYFSHNVESVNEGMFCFNVKSKRYALGNAEYPKDKYLKLKSELLEQIVSELEKSGKLRYTIYNIWKGGK